MTTEELIDHLASNPTIGGAPGEELAWLAKQGTLRHMQAGELATRQTEIVDGLYIILTGRMAIYADRGGGRRRLMEWQAGEVTGLLPYSRLTYPPGDTIIEEPTDVLTIYRKDLPALIHHCPEVTAALVHVMTDRARRFTSTDLRDEKMLSLGKLAAGLAHELNNPASAVMRDAKSMAEALAAAEEAARALGTAGLTSEQLSELDTVRGICMSAAADRPISALDAADREDTIAAWLNAHNVDETLAEDLARTPVTIEALNRLARVLEGGSLTAVLRWVAGGCAARLLASNIERAATRIQALVAAVKGFTHMDRALAQEPVDIPRGLADTVALLEGKARGKSVSISLKAPPDLPPIRGIGAEINQIWMNLIDNAIDAAPERGQVHVSASREGPHVLVEVSDDGTGIPPEIISSIFDPFFTTKSVGKGTGLGLDIVRRVVQWHNGDITVDSRPGRTEFRVTLPVAGKQQTGDGKTTERV